MGHNSLACCLLKASHSMGKNATSPEYTDDFVEGVLSEYKENTLPPEWDISFSRYKGQKYTIDRDGIVKWLDGTPLKHIFSASKLWPRVLIRRSVKRINQTEINDEYYEVNVLKIMAKIFGPYITGYIEMKNNSHKQYRLIPKDGDRANISVQNLKFISQKQYKEIGSKRAGIKATLSFLPNLTDGELAAKTGVSRAHISRVKWEMVDEGKLTSQKNLFEYREKYDINISQQNFPIYEVLLTCEGKLSNMEVVLLLRPEEMKKLSTTEEKRAYTDKIVRVRKVLADKGLIPQADSFDKKRDQAVSMLQNKANSWLTNQQIADQLWLKKDQIDNLARAIKKDWSKGTQEE